MDTTEEGRLGDSVPLKAFKEEGKFSTFGESGSAQHVLIIWGV